MEVTIKDKTYRVGRLDARRQFHVARRLAPVLSGLTNLKELVGDPMAALGPLADAIGAMSDKDADYILDNCLAAVERKQTAGGWAKIMVDGNLMFEDLDMVAMLRLVLAVIQENMSGFFGALPPDLLGKLST